MGTEDSMKVDVVGVEEEENGVQENKLIIPEIERMIGYAILHFVQGCYDQAIPVLHEVIRLAPNWPVPYHTLGLGHDALGDYKKAFNFYMCAARLKPNSYLLDVFFTWSKINPDD